MKKILFFTLCILLFQSCKKCNDVRLGSVTLMPSSTVLVNNLKSKTLIFKDSLGSELRFKNSAGLKQQSLKTNYKKLCDGPIGLGGGFEFLEFESQLLVFTTSDLNVSLQLEALVIDANQQTSEAKDTVLYDILSVQMYNPTGLTSISNQLELSKRGIIKLNKPTNNVVIETITILGRTFKQVVNVKNGLKSNDVEPAEVWYNATQGVVALRLLNGKLFVLDKVE